MRREYVGREYFEAWEALFDGLRNLFEDFKVERATERDMEGVVNVGIAFPARRAGLKGFGDISPRPHESEVDVRGGTTKSHAPRVVLRTQRKAGLVGSTHDRMGEMCVWLNAAWHD